MIDVDIVIVNWNTKDLLQRCLTHVMNGTGGQNVVVWVVDNNSTDGSAAMVRSEFTRVRLIENKQNLGFAQANNQALEQSNGRYYLLLNSDAFLSPDALFRLIQYMDQHPQAGMVGPKLKDENGRLQPSTYPLPSLFLELIRATRLDRLLPDSIIGPAFLGSYWHHNEPRVVGRLTGACILVRAEAARSVGLLDEKFPFYGEVHDWNWRMIKAGWEVHFTPDTSVVHVGGQSAKNRWNALEKRRRVLESNHRLLLKHKSRPFIAVWYLLQLFITTAGFLRRWNARDAETQREKGALVWEASWYLNRLGLGRLKDQWHTWQWNTPYLQSLFLASLAEPLKTDLKFLRHYLAESFEIERTLRKKWLDQQHDTTYKGMLELSSARLLYILLRAARPRLMVETGVANGASSTFLLSAMEKNGAGELYSLDLPVTPDGMTFIPKGKDPGWLVPDHLRKHWHLILGDTYKTLPPLLKELGKVPIFMHDSDHAYEAMRFEYEQAWEVLESGGWLISDDVNFNAAFDERVLASGGNDWVWAGRLGLLKKT